MYELKRRTDNKAMLVLMDSEAKLDRYVSDVPDIAWDLISVSDKPLTIIYSSAKNLATNLLGADGSVGIRITNEEFSKKLCERFRKPLVSTSANVSGEPSPANFSEVSEVIKEGCGLYRELSSGRYEQGRSVRHYQVRSRWACAGN